MKELIEKYQKRIEEISKEIDEDPEFQSEFEGEIGIIEMVIEDLKEYEKSLWKLPSKGQIYSIPEKDNYPSLRERLICASVKGLLSGNQLYSDDNHFVAKRSINVADEIIKQLNQ